MGTAGTEEETENNILIVYVRGWEIWMRDVVILIYASGIIGLN